MLSDAVEKEARRLEGMPADKQFQIDAGVLKPDQRK